MQKRHFRESILNVYRKEFLRDTAKFIRASRLLPEHLDTEMEFKGARVLFKGFIDDETAVIEDLDNKCHWILNKKEFEKAIL